MKITKILPIVALVLAMSMFTTRGAAQGGRGEGRNEGKGNAVRITDGPRVEGVGTTWAVIAWTTNTGGSSIIRYGTDPGRLSQMAESPYADNDRTKAQNHRVRVAKLRPHTKYYFIADSGQGEGTGTEAKSHVGEFTTK